MSAVGFEHQRVDQWLQSFRCLAADRATANAAKEIDERGREILAIRTAHIATKVSHNAGRIIVATERTADRNERLDVYWRFC